MPKIKNKTFFCTKFVCVIEHRNWPLRSTILYAHGTNASPDGFCTRTHANEPFSCWFCCNSFRVYRAKRGNVCVSSEGMLSYRSACPDIRRWLGYQYYYENLIYFNISNHVRRIAWSGVSPAWCLQRRSRLMPSRNHSSNLHVI